jgi:CDP-diglyceride synthetase
MKTRVITGTVVTLFMLAVVCLYATPVFAIAISVICAMAVYELLRAFEMHKVWILSIPALIIAAVLPTVSFVLFKILGKEAFVFITVLALTFFIFMLYTISIDFIVSPRQPLKHFNLYIPFHYNLLII